MTCDVPVLDRRTKLFADSLRVVEPQTDDELVPCKRNRFWQVLGELATSNRAIISSYLPSVTPPVVAPA